MPAWASPRAAAMGTPFLLTGRPAKSMIPSYLEPGYGRERVDGQGHILGFGILGVSRFRKESPLEAELTTDR